MRRTFVLVLIHTGCRISEALALRPAQIDIRGRAIVFRTLKKRDEAVFRTVPVPYTLIADLVRTFGLKAVRIRRGCGLSHGTPPISG